MQNKYREKTLNRSWEEAEENDGNICSTLVALENNHLCLHLKELENKYPDKTEPKGIGK